MEQPLVSIIVPTYNRSADLIKAINSVIRQSYNNWELLIIDDRSTDDTKLVMKELCLKDAKIKYYVNTRKKGVSGARNTGLKQASGKFIAFLDSDDLWLRNHLTKSVEVLMSTSYKVCYSLWLEKKEGKLTKVDRLPGNQQNFQDAMNTLKPVKANKTQLFWDDNFLNYVIRTGFYCFHINTLVMDREVVKEIGMFNERFIASEDTDFSFRIFERYRICLIWQYSYIYHRDIGVNNLYNFYDRNAIQLEQLIQNKELVTRFNMMINNNILRYKILKKLIQESKRLSNKEETFKWIQHTLMAYYYTLFLLNSIHNKRESLRYAIKYFIISKDKSILQFMLHKGPEPANIKYEYIDIY